uniref:(northern house mosquito) hypothetical protein n=1 Tax=Culex pipiens TaxID=7175 RepID=A0A8D8DLU3_CULPI
MRVRPQQTSHHRRRTPTQIDPLQPVRVRNILPKALPHFVTIPRDQHLAQVQMFRPVLVQRPRQPGPIVDMRVLHPNRAPQPRMVRHLVPHPTDAARPQQLLHLQILERLLQHVVPDRHVRKEVGRKQPVLLEASGQRGRPCRHASIIRPDRGQIGGDEAAAAVPVVALANVVHRLGRVGFPDLVVW